MYFDHYFVGGNGGSGTIGILRSPTQIVQGISIYPSYAGGVTNAKVLR